ncbi:hypothetical protein BJ742DRAFT_736750 [Cladochytrium replicatum]|nr:hypothetical protein BJ742DRAFT_736750 [Cladochytrium replicatum]
MTNDDVAALIEKSIALVVCADWAVLHPKIGAHARDATTTGGHLQILLKGDDYYPWIWRLEIFLQSKDRWDEVIEKVIDPNNATDYAKSTQEDKTLSYRGHSKLEKAHADKCDMLHGIMREKFTDAQKAQEESYQQWWDHHREIAGTDQNELWGDYSCITSKRKNVGHGGGSVTSVDLTRGGTTEHGFYVHEDGNGGQSSGSRSLGITNETATNAPLCWNSISSLFLLQTDCQRSRKAECWCGKKPDISPAQVFGCDASSNLNQ